MSRSWVFACAGGLAVSVTAILHLAATAPASDAPSAVAGGEVALQEPASGGNALSVRRDAITAAKAALRQSDSPAHTIKPTAAIGVEYAFKGAPRTGLPLDLVLTIRPQSSLRQAELRLGGSEGLIVSSPASPIALPDLAAGETTEIAVTVLPVVAEALYLHVDVAGLLGGLPQARSLDVPVRLAPAAVTAVKLTPDASGRPLRTFRARERQR